MTATLSPQNLARVIRPKCRRCGHHRPVEEFVAGGPVVGYCLRCLEHNYEVVEHLSDGKLPRGCHECNTSLADLSARELGADVRLYIHLKDGIYQLLCKTCDAAYVQKRADLYRNTPFGAANKI